MPTASHRSLCSMANFCAMLVCSRGIRSDLVAEASCGLRKSGMVNVSSSSHTIGTLKNSLLHFPFEKGLEDWIEKHNRYSTAEARQNVYGYTDDDVLILDLFSIATDRRRRAAKKIFRRLPCRATLRFIYM